VSTFFSHFSKPDATWESFGKADTYVEFLKLHLEGLLHSVEAELQARNAVEPTDFGT
jgi:predicted alpha/beta superfamily hydrolase